MGTLQLMELASKFGISINDGDGKETVIYAILDKAAETEATSTTATQKRKRTRIVKKDTDKVYTVSGTEGENYDVRANKTPEKPSLFSDSNTLAEAVATDNADATVAPTETPKDNMTAAQAEEVPAPAPKRRGRKPKVVEVVEDVVPEAAFQNEENAAQQELPLIEMLQEKMAVDSGYFLTYTFDPRLAEKGESPLKMSSKPDFSKIKDFLLTSTRYSQLPRVNPDHAEELFEKNRKYAEQRYHDILRYGGQDK